MMTCDKPEAVTGRVDVYAARVIYDQRMLRISQRYLMKDRADLEAEKRRLDEKA